jgi:hypothetical protein
MEEQIKLLKKYNITDYVVENGKLVITQEVDLFHLKTIEENFLKGVYINEWLDLRSLTTVPEGFLQNAVVNGGLYLNSLTTAPKGFLQNAVVNKWLYLNSLTISPKWFLESTVINGWLYLGLKRITSYKEIIEGSESDFNILPLHNIELGTYLGNRCRVNLKGTVKKYPDKNIKYYC